MLNTSIQAVCELKYFGNVISPDGEGHVKNDMHTFKHITKIIYMNYDQIICMNMYLKLYKTLFKSVGKFGTEA